MLASLIAGIALAGGTTTNAGWIWGVTIDDPTNSAAIVDSLRNLPARTTARVVFDPGAAPADYLGDVEAIHNVANVMGEPVDSEPANTSLTVTQYRQRMAQYMDGLGSSVDLWEIGNEVNGDWTGVSRTVGQKVTAAYQEAKARGKKTAITLFYSDSYAGTSREMALWSMINLPVTVRLDVDYVFVSFYPTSATGTHPDWAGIFGRLSRVFGKAKFGFGELGLANADGTLSTNQAAKAQLIQRYYEMASPLGNRYVGGYFWWTFAEDAVPKSDPLWTTFDGVIR